MNKCTLSLHKNLSWFTSEHYEGIPCSDLQRVGRREKEISWQPMVRMICAHSGTNMKIVHLVSRQKRLRNNSGGCVSRGSVSRLKVNPDRAQQSTRQKVRGALTVAAGELWMKAHYEKRLDKNSLHPQAFLWRQAQNKMQETLTEKPRLHVKSHEHSSCKIKDSSTNRTLLAGFCFWRLGLALYEQRFTSCPHSLSTPTPWTLDIAQCTFTCCDHTCRMQKPALTDWMNMPWSVKKTYYMQIRQPP